MRIQKFLITLVSIIVVLSFPLTAAVALSPAGEGSGVDVSEDPVQIYPVNWEIVFDKTPTFRFTQYNEITKYRVTVRNAFDESIVYYTYKGNAACAGGVCELTPDVSLAGGVVTFQSDTKGMYQWTVQAKTAPGEWSGVQSYKDFLLGTPGFDSQFTLDKKGWVDRYAQWVVTSAGYLKNIGLELEYTSTLYKKHIFKDFTYEAKIKLKSSPDYVPADPNRHFGGIIIYGNGTLNTEPDFPSEMNVWRKGIYIVFRNNQQAGIFIYDGGTLIGGSGWQPCASIVANDWNRIKVVVMGETLEVYVNGTYWKTLSHPFANDSGYVGLTQYRYMPDTEKMLVDWARLEVDTP
jgi:hypothetical protein